MALDTAAPDRTPPSGPSPIPSIVSSLTPDVPDLPGGSYGDVPDTSDTSVADTSDRGDTLPFIPPGMSQDQIDKLRDKDVRILDEEIGAKAAAQRDLDRRDREFESRMERLNSQMMHGLDNIHPWNADREMAARKHDLWEEFGSPGFVVAMIASSFTAYPMVSALNAGAAAMNAINQGDIDGYDKAFSAWQQNTRLALDRMKTEQDAFSNLDSLRKTSMARWKEELSLKLDGFGDKRKKALLEAGFDDEVIKAVDAQETLRGKLENNYKAQMENKALFDEVQRQMKADKDAGKEPNFFRAYTKAVEGLTQAKSAGRYGQTITAQQRDEITRRRAAWDADNPKATEPERNAAYDQITSDVVTSYHPIEKQRADIAGRRADVDAAHKDRMAAVAEGKLAVEQAREEENADYKKRMAAIAEQREGREEAAEAEKERHALAIEELTRAKIAKPQPATKASLEKEDKDALREQVVKDHPDWTNAEIVKEVDKQYGAMTAKRSGTPEAVALDKFMEENPKATAQQIQAFRALGKTSRSAAGAAISKFIAENPEATAEDITRFGAHFNRAQTYARTVGSRAANVDTAVVEAEKAAKIALKSSEAVTRTDYTYLNKYYQDLLRGVSDPKQTAFDVANASLITAYSQTMSRTGGNTVTAQNRAMEVLSTATGPKGYRAAVNMLLQEMHIVQSAVNEVGEGGKAPSPADSGSQKWERKPDGTLGPVR